MNILKKYIWLVDTLLRAGEKGLTLSQIADKYDYDDDISNGDKFNGRTFHRHRKEIKTIFGIEIECYPTGNEFRYRIADGGDNEYFRRWLLDSISVNRIVSDSREAAQFIAIEHSNTEQLPALLHALKDQNLIDFKYKPFWTTAEIPYHDVQPYALKMFEHRWYLIGKSKPEMPCKIYALDRIGQLEVKKEQFQRDPDFDLEAMFDGSFGIIVETGEVESVWLKVEAKQANYLRSLPLHSSQMELRQNDSYSVFSLRVRPTFDLRQRILSLGSTTEVLKPESLRATIRQEAKTMMEKYKDDED